jgi:glycosyltransferase involved in cell wall biosynthesis
MRQSMQAEPHSIFYLVRPAAGGMRGHLRALIDHFGRFCPVHLAAPPGCGMESWPGRSGGRYFALPLPGALYPPRDLASFRLLRRALESVSPSLLHMHGFKAALIGLPAARLSGVPALVTVHNYPAERGRAALPAVLRAAGGSKTGYIAVSRALARVLSGWGIAPSRLSVIHNGIDPAPFETAGAGRPLAGQAPGKLVVGTAARLARQKGLAYFLGAAARLAPLFPAMRFEIVGDGPERCSLEKLTRRLRLEERVSFTGYRTDLPACLAGMDIFVLPSLTEGLAITLLEAMAAGCAVVASQVGGVPEAVEDGINGLLVPPGDDAALAEAVASLAGDPVRAAALTAAARRVVRERFSLAAMLSRTEAVYRRQLVQPVRCVT